MVGTTEPTSANLLFPLFVKIVVWGEPRGASWEGLGCETRAAKGEHDSPLSPPTPPPQRQEGHNKGVSQLGGCRMSGGAERGELGGPGVADARSQRRARHTLSPPSRPSERPGEGGAGGRGFGGPPATARGTQQRGFARGGVTSGWVGGSC